MNLDKILDKMETIRYAIVEVDREVEGLDNISLDNISQTLNEIETEINDVMDDVIEIQDALTDIENSISNVKW